MRGSGNEGTSPCLTMAQGSLDALFFNEATTGLTGHFPAVDKALPLSAFWVRRPIPGRWPVTGSSSQNKSLASLGLS